MIYLTEEQARQIEEIVEHLLVDHPTARHHKACVEALSIIRAARAQEQAEQEPVAYLCPSFVDNYATGRYETCERTDYGAFPVYRGHHLITTPDVCGEVCTRAKLCYGCNKDLEEANAKYAEQAEQEPVAIIEKESGFETEVYATGHADDLPDGVFKLYAAPVRTKDLTDDEVFKIIDDFSSEYAEILSPKRFARAVIAADREKNK